MLRLVQIVRWIIQHKTTIATILGIVVLIVAGIWFWGVLVNYVDPEAKGAKNRKDIVQAFALIVAGVVAVIGGIVGIVNVSVSRRNLRQQIELEDQRRYAALELEDQRSQDVALQAYFKQMGDLLTDHNLIGTDREDIRQLARAQTLTVLSRLDGPRKGALVRFLHGAGLIKTNKTIVVISGADFSAADLSKARLGGANLSGADLSGADLSGAYLGGAYLQGANLDGANLNGANLSNATLVSARLSKADLSNASLTNVYLGGANLSGAILSDARLSRAIFSRSDLSNVDFSGVNLDGADLFRTNLRGAKVTEKQLAACASLAYATMPNGKKYEDWLKAKIN